MCGIVATLLHPQERSITDWETIREMTTLNLIYNEERGNAATGVAVLQLDGRVAILKRAMPASRFIRTREYQNLMNGINSQTALILGHTRLPTKGTPEMDGNNHPVQAGPVFGVHNGRINNDDALFARFGYPRKAQVDSEIIFRLLEPISPRELDGNYLRSIRPWLQMLQGEFTFMACDQRQPGKLLVLKHNNPLCVHFHPGWNALIFSSRYIFLRKAFGRSLVAEALQHDTLMLFNAQAIPSLGMQPSDFLPFHTVA